VTSRGGFTSRRAALAIFFVIGACTPTNDSPPNLLLVVIDTCRVDRLSLYGYDQPTTPNLKKLGAGAVVFEQAVSHVPQTLPSVATILTSTPPAEHGVRVNGLFQLPATSETLAELLREKGYATAGVVSAFPLDSRFAVNQGFDFYDADFSASILTRTRQGFSFQGTRRQDFEQRADEATDKALTWLKQTTDKDAGRRFFLLVHYFDPHFPYDPPADRVDLKGYDGEIALADAEIGRLMDGIRGLGRLDDTLVVVVGDHGEILDPRRPLARHAGYLEDAVLRVPLLMRLPGKLPTGHRVGEQIGLLDLAPTILELLDVPAPPQFRGRSLVPLMEGKATRHEQKVYFETLYWTLEEKRGLSRYGVRTPELKFVLNLQSAGGTSTRQEELYDLKADPGETRNLMTDPTASAPYAGLLEGLRKGVIAHAEAKQDGLRRTLTQGDEERLRALGYLGAK